MSRLFEDPYLAPYLDDIARRRAAALDLERRLVSGDSSPADFASGHEYFGLHRTQGGWVFREWAPNAERIYLIGDLSNWEERDQYSLNRIDAHGRWEIQLTPADLKHGDLYKLRIYWPGGSGDRIPAYARRVVQDESTKIFSAQVWAPPSYVWRNDNKRVRPDFPLIYESHVGMAQEKEAVGTYAEFADNILPRISEAGYNTVQLMAVMEHPYYASFGYHVSSFFAASSRFGTPEELKALVDEAHGMNLAVIVDIIHSHAVANEVEGLARFDGTEYQYFHGGGKGNHPAWGSKCFDYGKPEVIHFLLSNCRFWLDEYHVDGFRFDGVTSMLYSHHGLAGGFSSYDAYFGDEVDEQAIAYLSLANKVIHQVNPNAMTIAEDVSGMPGLAAPINDGGCGFDYRLAMGVPDCWFKLVKDIRDEEWDMNYLWHELNNRRSDEQTVSYAECHDQALVGGKTLIFEMIDADMYNFMRTEDHNLRVDRGIALHKVIRLATLGTAGHGYLNFIGNEFGHPEWVDFPREGNNWSYHYAKRRWSLRDNHLLKYHQLGDFDRALLETVKRGSGFEKRLPRLLSLRDDLKILAFERGGLFFFVNLHPHDSVTDFAVEVPPGEYTLELDTDRKEFGGFGRLEPGQAYFTQPVEDTGEIHNYLRVYLPCRCALVLKRSI